MRKHEGTSQQNGVGNRQTGARPAQGAATTTDEGSLQSGEKAGDEGVSAVSGPGTAPLLQAGDAVNNGAHRADEVDGSVDDDEDIKPVGKGVFGGIYDQFKGKVREAVNFLRRIKSGEAKDVLYHHDIGNISLVWGNEKYGLEHILSRHPDVLDGLQKHLEAMHVVSSSSNRIVLESDTHKAVVSKMLGDEKTPQWLLTAYEKKTAPGGSSDIVPGPNDGKLNGTAPQQSSLMSAKVGNSSESGDKKSEKISAIDCIPSDEVTDKTGNTRTVHHWEQAEPGDTYDALTEIYHNNADRVKKGVQNRINAIDKQIKATQKKMDAIDNSDDFDAVAAQGEQYDRLQQQKDALEQQKKYWQGVQSVPLNRRAEQDKRTEAEQAAAKAERAKAEAAAIEEARRERERVNGVPDAVNDTPSDARKRGFRNVNGMVVERQQKTDGVTGRESSVKFSSKDTAQGHIKVIDADELQPSHVSGQRNPQFFIDEAQPKDRTDAASSMAAAKIASSLNPEEITGDGSAYQFSAPTVNSRGEVIQGNNRSDALKLMYSTPAFKAAQDAYKQYIIDHASDFGFTPEDVEKIKQMQHPVMVNELDVSDDEAIRLGQMKASDNESGGIERIDPVTTSKKLGSKVGSFARILLSSGDEDASLSDVLAENGGKAVQWLRAQGVISDTAEQSAFDKKGNLTAEAKQDLQNILKQSLFEGGVSDLPTMFERMPAKAQKAILSTFMRDFDSAESERILPEIQKAIEAWYGCATSNDAFAKAGNYKSARAAMRDWTLQTNMLDDSMPSDKFSNFAMELACRLQGCTMREVQQNLNDFFDLVQGKSQGDLFGGTTMGEQADRQEAIRRVFDIDYKPIKNKENGKKGSDAVADNDSQGGEGRPGSTGDGAGRERAAGAGQHADVAGGAESHDEEVSKQTAPKPIGIGFFGNIYNQFKGKAKEAYNLLSRLKSGIAINVFERKDIGGIALVWGDDKGGLYHIVKKHIIEHNDFANVDEALEVIKDVLNNGSVSRENADKVNIDWHGYRVSVRKQTRDEKGNVVEKGNWVVTAFDKTRTEKEKTPSRETLTTPPSNHVADGVTLPSNGVSAAKVGNSSESDDKKSEKVGEGADNSVKEAAEQHRSTERSNDSVHSIGATDTPGKVTAERQNVNTEPTEGQKEAGNYKKGHIKVDGYDITIENPKGSTRSGKDASGKAWSVPMHYDYGYIKGTEGVDGDHIDVYLSDEPTKGNVYVVDQVNQNDGSFDEHKVMYGFPSMKAAVEAYKGQYEDGWKVGTVTEVSREDFKKWVENSKRKTKPFAEYKSVETAAQQQRPTDSIEARPAQGTATTTDEGLVRTHERTSLQSGEKGDVKQMKAGGGVVSVSKREAALRDAVVDLEREAGLDVIDDVEEGQRVLDMFNGEAKLMGSRTNKKMANIGEALEGRELTERQQKVVDVFRGKSDNTPIEVERADGKVRVIMRQGNDEKAGTKHSLYGHYGTNKGVITDEDILIIPDVLARGERTPKMRGNTQLYEYTLNGENGTRYTVLTEKKHSREEFADFYTNKKTSQSARKTRSEEARDIDNNDVSSAKLQQNSDTSKEMSGKIREQRVYHGSAADFDAFDHSHMGEGEGAQAHGWGTYVTKNKGVGMTYAAKSNKATGLKRSELESNIHRAEDQLPYLHGDVKAEKEKELKAWKDELAKLDDTKLVYTVEIPDDTGNNYLEEAQTLQDLNRPDMAGRIDKVMDDYFGAKDFWNSWQTPGLAMREEFIRLSMGQHLEKSRSDAERKYSKLLSEAGVVGLHYNGRKDGDCYVIFNDKDLKIKDKVRFFRTADGEAYGFTVGGKIYIDPRIATSETPIHEYAHLWAEALRKANPKEWQNVVELMKECKSVWEQVKKEYPELKTDDEIADEVLAHYSGRRGAERLRQEAAKAAEDAKGVLDKASVVSGFDRLREAIRKAWKHIAEDILHIHFTSAEEVSDKVMYDLLNKVKPGTHDQLAEERAEIERRAKDVGEAQNVDYSSDEENEDVLYRDSEEDNDNMRSVASDNDDKLRVTTLPLNMRLPVNSYSGEATTLQAANAIQNLGPTVFTLDGYELSVSRKTKKKLSNQLSQNANKGYYKIALEHLPEIIGNSVLVEEHRDRTKVNGERTPESPSDQNIDRTQRFYGAVNINGKSYRVKTTAVVLKQGNNRMHSYEVTKMELLISTPTENSQEAASSSNSITLANLLQNVEFSYEKGKKILDQMQNNADVSDNDILYRVEDDPEELKKLEMEPKVKVYRAMQLIDDKLYPPMAAKVNGSLVEPAEPGQWLRADEHPELAKNGLFTLNKGGKDASGKRLGSVPAAYNPYWHTSRSPLNDQFSSAYKRPNLVTVEVEIPKSELTSGYHADGAKDPVGEMSWHAGPVSSKLPKEKERKVILSRWCKVVRVVPDAEVADKVAGMLKGENISVPDNTVTPSLRRELEKRGVPITHTKMVEDWERKYPSGKEDYAREGDGAYTDDELSELNDPFVKMLGEKARSAKQRKAFAARERRNMADAVRELAERLHLDNVEIVTEPMEVKDRRGKVHHPKGFFNTKTGKITVVIPNHANVDDAVQTLLHEAVAHYGLRQLFGEHFDTFLRNVYEAADMDVRRRITELALRKYGGDFRVATEEYLASLAEKTDFENMPHGFWQKIKRMFLAMLHAIGFDGFADMGVTLSDNELRYILWRSYENLKEPGEHRSILGEAEDVAKLVELKVGNYGETAAEEEPADVAERREEKIGRLTPDFLQAFRTWLLVKRDYDKSVRDDPTSERSQALRDEFNACKGWMYDAMDMLHDLDLNINLRELLKDNGFNERELEEYDYWFGGDGVAEEEPSGAGYVDALSDEVSAYPKRVQDWLSQGNLDRARGKNLKEIIAMFGNKPEPIAYVPKEYLYVLGNDVTDNRLYSGKGYFIDHALNHHSQIETKTYGYIQEVLSHPDAIKPTNEGVTFIKKIDRWNAVVVNVEKTEKGKIIWHKSFYDQNKEIYKNRPDLKKKEPSVDATPTINPAAKAVGSKRNVSTLDDSAAKLGNNVGSAVNKGENVSEPEVWEQSHDENVGERTHERTSLQNGVGNRQTGARPAQGAATTTDEGSIRAGEDNSADRLWTHERTSLQTGEDRLRTHEGTSQQNGENRLRTHEGTSQQAGEVTDARPEAWGKKDLLSKAEQISNGVDPELLFRDSIEDDDNTARETYNRMADEKKNIIREAWQDSMINVRNLQDAVLKQRGEKPEAWEDAYNEENRMHGRSRAESEYFTDNFYKPLLKAVNAVAKAAKVSVGDVTEYMMAKHGLERNIVFASRDAQKAYDKAHQKAQEEYEALMNAAFAESDAKKRDALMRRAQKVKFPDHDELYNHYRGRDYSGLTDLTGKDDVQEAEAEAQRIVADMESRSDTSELWKVTNAATEWTLKKAYESGMMSRDNYDYVRSMFSYYIPLRGWEEDTAGDLYDYVGSGDKGTAFSPTLHKAKGRRSQADNPIAYIGSMAVSAIVQGNKNKVKQTFMRFAENHPTNLITVSEMWYRNYGTDAAPDWREAHEQYAPFCRPNKPISRCKKGLFTTRKSLFRKKQ